MALTFATLTDLYAHGADAVIDVRSPAEFAEVHLPGAMNLPVLANEERAEVGTIYVQESPCLARKIGAAKVCRNAAHHIATRLRHLEGLAQHRGSLLGEMADPQPAQKAFESALAGALVALDPDRPVLVEAESNKIGQRIIPPTLWEAMKQAPRIEMQAPIGARCDYLVRAYDDILSDGERLRDRLSPLRAHRGHAVVDAWEAMIDAGDKPGLTQALMEQHYDPAYEKSRRAIGADVMAQVAVKRLDAAGTDEAAERIAGLLAG
jgi:tRNA 2-selenouridine synthase